MKTELKYIIGAIMKTELKLALRHLKDGGDISQACIEYSRKTNSTASLLGLITIRELINTAIQQISTLDNKNHAVLENSIYNLEYVDSEKIILTSL